MGMELVLYSLKTIIKFNENQDKPIFLTNDVRWKKGHANFKVQFVTFIDEMNVCHLMIICMTISLAAKG